MREAMKRLTADSMVYGLGQVGGRAVQLLLVPILTRALSQGAFGVSELVIAYSQTALLVLVLGMDGALGRFFYQEPDRESRIRMVSTSLAFRLATGGLAAILLAAFAAPLSRQLIGGDVYAKYFTLGAATLPFTLLVLFCNDVLRVTFQPWKFIVLNITQTALVASLSLWMVLSLKAGVVGVLYGRLAGDALSAALGLALIRHTVRPRFSRAALRRMLGYGVPLVPALFAFGAIASVDRYVLQRTRSLEELAVYAVATKFFTIVTIAASAFQLAYGPFAYARAQTPEAPRLFARVLAAYVSLASLGAMVVGMLAPEALAILVPPTYRGAALPALWLAFAAVALGVYTVTSVGIGLALKTPLLSLCAGGAALVAIGAHWVLTPRFGAPGAGVATFLGYGVSAVLTYRVAQRVHPLPYRGARLAVLFTLACGIALAAQRLSPAGLAGLAIKLAAALGFILLCVRLGVWTERGSVAGA
jgi:O-antigen/teichoic acid export membrane protein